MRLAARPSARSERSAACSGDGAERRLAGTRMLIPARAGPSPSCRSPRIRARSASRSRATSYRACSVSTARPTARVTRPTVGSSCATTLVWRGSSPSGPPASTRSAPTRSPPTRSSLPTQPSGPLELVVAEHDPGLAAAAGRGHHPGRLVEQVAWVDPCVQVGGDRRDVGGGDHAVSVATGQHRAPHPDGPGHGQRQRHDRRERRRGPSRGQRHHAGPDPHQQRRQRRDRDCTQPEHQVEQVVTERPELLGQNEPGQQHDAEDQR